MRFTAAALAAMLVALVVPPTAGAASPFGSIVIRDVCTTSGSDFGYGHAVLKVGAVEFGRSRANYMVFRARLQKRVAGSWKTVAQLKWRTDSFPNDEQAWTWWYRARWAFPSPRPPTRIVMRVRFWDERPGRDVLLASHRHVGQTCWGKG